MGISTRSDNGRAPPNTADSDPARSTQTRESIVAFKLPSHSGGLSLPESWGRPQDDLRAVRKSSRVSIRHCVRVSTRLCRQKRPKKKKRRGKKPRNDPRVAMTHRSGHTVWRQERFNLLDSTRVRRESEPVRRGFDPVRPGGGGGRRKGNAEVSDVDIVEDLTTDRWTMPLWSSSTSLPSDGHQGHRNLLSGASGSATRHLRHAFLPLSRVLSSCCSRS